MNIKRLAAMGLAACMLFMTAACGTASTGTDSGQQQGATQEETASEVQTDEQAQETAGEVQTAGKLVIALSTDPGSNFPMGMKTSAGLEYLPFVYQQLFASDGNGGIIGESFEMQEDDELTYIMKIRQDVYDTLGNHMTASDVIWSINYNREVLGNVGGLPDLDYVELGDDDYTVIWHMKQPLNVATYEKHACNPTVICQAAFEASEGGMVASGDGTGPYVFKEYVPGSSLTLVKNEDYWADGIIDAPRALANVDELSFVFIPEASQRAIALEQGEVDYAVNINMTDLRNFEDESAFQLVRISSAAPFQLMFNSGQDSPCQDINLRKAILYGIDVPAICAAVDADVEQAYTLAPNATDAPEDFGEARKYWDYDADAAKDYLSQTSYSGEPLTLLFATNSVTEAAALVIESQLKEIGINVSISQLDSSMFNVDQYKSDGYDMIINTYAGGTYVCQQIKHFNYDNYTQSCDGLGVNFVLDDTARDLVLAELADNSEENCWAIQNYIDEMAYSCALYSVNTIHVARAGMNITRDPGSNHAPLINATTFDPGFVSVGEK